MEGFDALTTLEDLAVFVYAAGHSVLAVLGFIAGWLK